MKFSTTTHISFFAFFFIVFSFANVHAQTESPYSRYAIGDLQYNGFIRQIGMGGISAAYQNSSAVNFGNPASYSGFRITSFETSANIETRKSSNTTSSQTNKGAALNYLAVGFPVVKNAWGAAFGLIPLSKTGYDLKSTGSIYNPNDTITYNYNEVYRGSGGLNRFFIGNGFAPFANSTANFLKSARYYKLVEQNDTAKITAIKKKQSIFSGLSAGVNASYLFGSLTKERKVEFQGVTNIFNTAINDLTYYGDFYFDYGVQYKAQLKNEWKLSLGISGALAANVKGSRDQTWYTYKSSAFSSTDIVRDTVSYVTGLDGKTTIPQYWNAGFTIQKEKWMIGFDYGMQDWSTYKSFGVKDQSLVNSYHAALGGYYSPKNKAQYRAGVNYAKTYLDLKETSINDASFSIGAGLPIRLTQAEKRAEDIKSMIHFAIVGGQKGTTDNNLLKEQYVRFYVGVTFNELWFVKRKYD